MQRIAGRDWREPFDERTWSELVYFFFIGLLAGVGVAFIGVTMVGGVVLAVTFVGLVIIAGRSAGPGASAGFHRALARALLGEDIDDPEPFVARPGFLGWLQSALRDRVGWRAVAYVAVKMPLVIFGIWFAFSVWVDAFFCLTYPLWVTGGTRPAGFGLVVDVFQPGFLSGAARGSSTASFIFLTGVLLVFVAPWPMRAWSTSTADSCASCSAPTPWPPGCGRSSRPGPRPSTPRPPPCGGSSATCTTAPRPSWWPWPCGWAGQGETGGRRRPTSTSTRCAHWWTTPTRGPRRPSSSCGTWPGASTPRRSTPAWKEPWPRWPPAAPSRPNSRSSLADRPTPAIEAIAYFCVAELLANVAQHAHASQASISCTQHGAWLRLVVRDDGAGGAQLTMVGSSSSGLAGLTDRVARRRRASPHHQPARRTDRGHHRPAAARLDDRRSIRVAIAEDSAVLRDGLVQLLADRGFVITDAVASPRPSHARSTATAPTWPSIDIRMPPTFTDEGLRPPSSCAGATRASGSCCSPSTSRPATPPTCWPTTPPASATC